MGKGCSALIEKILIFNITDLLFSMLCVSILKLNSIYVIVY